MLRNGTPVTVSYVEGQALLMIASGFQLPEKLGEQAYSIGERALAGDEVRQLYKELRLHSPLMLSPDKLLHFGSRENYEKIQNNGSASYKMIDRSKEVSLELSGDAFSGLVWCLVLSIHPGSPICQAVGVQEDIFWPLAERVKRTRIIRETIGFSKASPRRWKADEEFEEKGNGTASPKEVETAQS